MTLTDRQRKLKLKIIEYRLNDEWHAHDLIQELRERIAPLLPTGIFDPQDLEHQVLFRLTTFKPDTITDDVLRDVIEEQKILLQARLDASGADLAYLFRGLSGKYPDLNVNRRLKLTHEGGRLIARDDQRSFDVEFRTVDDPRMLSLFTDDLHYMHRERLRGEAFGLFFAGDPVPWAIETTEPTVIAKSYKRDALLAHGIDPNKAVELTRFYTLPGAPRNAISVMDGLVSKYYRDKGIEALTTTTMPMYSKTRSTTIAGGLNEVLLIKSLCHRFLPEQVAGRACCRHVTEVPTGREDEVITNHPDFPTQPVVEVFKRLAPPSVPPHGALANGKAIWVSRKEGAVEREAKFEVRDIGEMTEKLRGVAKHLRTEYLRDTIYGCEGPGKIRLRTKDSFGRVSYEAMRKTPTGTESGMKNEVEEILYAGTKRTDALEAIAKSGGRGEENGYEKIRATYACRGTEISLDIYPFGCWLEVEGEPNRVWEVANLLGFDRTKASAENADNLFLAWARQWKLPEFWDVRFGLTGAK
jgi:adenylate cyclase class IV